MYVCIYLAYINIYINYKYSYVCVRTAEDLEGYLMISMQFRIGRKKQKTLQNIENRLDGGLGAKGG